MDLINTPKIKICGIRRKSEINIINKYPIDYVGFVFAKSKRQVSPERVTVLKKYLRKDIKTVGVFVNESMAEIKKISELCQLDVIQLHGNQINDQCAQYKKEVWKSISIKDYESLKTIDDYDSNIKILMDTYVKKAADSDKGQGGSGIAFNWSLAKGLSKKRSIILAGGLNAENVKQAIEIVEPEIVDVSSGVEDNKKGLGKSEDKIKTFVRRVKYE